MVADQDQAAQPHAPPPGGAGGRVCVAQFGAAHGVRGEIRLKAFTTDPMALRGYGPLETEDGSRRFEITALRPGKDMLVARLKGVGDRTAAEALRNLRLFVPRSRLAPPSEDEFYHADLIGLEASDTRGRKLGTVVAVHNFGAGDLLEIAPVARPSVFVPFTKAVVPIVDLAGRTLVIDPPDGLLDDDTAQERRE